MGGGVRFPDRPILRLLPCKLRSPSLLDRTKAAILVDMAIGPDASHASAALFVKHLTVAAS